MTDFVNENNLRKEEFIMFCSKCGQQISDSALFCKFCGTKVEQKTSSEATGNSTYAPVNNDAGTYATAANNSGAYSSNASVQSGATQNVTLEEFYNNHYSEKGKKNFKIFTIAAYVVLAIIVGSCIYTITDMSKAIKIYNEANLSFPGKYYLYYLLPIIIPVAVIGMHLKKNVIFAYMGFGAIVWAIILICMEVLVFNFNILSYACLFWYAKEVIIINKAYKQFVAGNYLSE